LAHLDLLTSDSVGRRSFATQEQENSKEHIMTPVAAIGVVMIASLLLAASADRASAQVGRPSPPPAPKIVIRPPTVPTLQQPSFWGVNTNLQHQRDRLQRTWGNGSGSANDPGALSSTSPPQ
jgi:hypothetical protein